MNKVVLITGASSGIGKSIGEFLHYKGFIVYGTSRNPDKVINSVFQLLELDVRNTQSIQNAVKKVIELSGKIDIVINNASAIQLTDTENTPSKRFDLMHSINVRGTFLVVQHALPYLKKSSHAHILTLSPPINLAPKWLGPHVAYTLSKYDMSMLTLGWAEEFKEDQIACNSLWPRTTIDTAAVRNLLGGEILANMSRTPAIIADAALFILSKEKLQYTGKTFIDEDVLAAEGITDLAHYSVVPGAKLFYDLFL